MNKPLSFISLIAVAALAGYIGAKASGTGVSTDVTAKQETAFDRVMKTQTLRCAYISRAHYFTIDPATKQISGINYEIMEAIANILHLKIDWVEETGYGAFPEQLNSGKEDALCTTVFSGASWAARTLFTAPLTLNQLNAYVREDDMRFDNNADLLNDEKVTFAVIDGSMVKAAAETSFPKAKQFSVTQLSDDSQAMLNVITRKADAMFTSADMANDFNKHRASEGKLRRVAGIAPIRSYSEVFAVSMGEFELREMFNIAINELHNNGTIERIIRKYETTPGEVTRVVMPYAYQGKQ